MGWARLSVFVCMCVCECVHTCVCVLMCGFVGLGVRAGGVCVFWVVGGCVILSLYVSLFVKLCWSVRVWVCECVCHCFYEYIIGWVGVYV